MQDATTLAVEPSSSRIYYGWIMLPLSMLALMATSVGQTYCISAFNKPIGISLNLDDTALAQAYMLGTILGAIPISYFGYLMDRFGLRATILVTLSLLSLACFSLAMTTGFFMLVVSFCLLRMLGPGTLAMLSGNMMAFWFHRRLGTVEAIRKLSLSFAMGGVPLLNLWLLQSMSWRQAYWLWGGIVWVSLFPLCYLFFRNHPEDVGQSLESRLTHRESQVETKLTGLTFQEAVRTAAFWSLTFGAGLYAMVMTAIVFNRVSIMEQQGMQEWHSAIMISVLSITAATSQFISGSLSDRIPAKPLLVAGHLLFGFSVFCLIQSQTTGMVLLTGSLLGIAQGLFSGASHPIWARYFGRLHLGKITGFWMTAMVAVSACGPYLAGVLRDESGSFEQSLMIFALIPIPIAILTLLTNFTPPTQLANEA